jgi:hypothetical protein
MGQFLKKCMTGEIWADLQDGFSKNHLYTLNSYSASMFRIVVPLVDKFGNMGFVKDHVVVLLCYSKSSNNH